MFKTQTQTFLTSLLDLLKESPEQAFKSMLKNKELVKRLDLHHIEDLSMAIGALPDLGRWSSKMAGYLSIVLEPMMIAKMEECLCICKGEDKVNVNCVYCHRIFAGADYDSTDDDEDDYEEIYEHAERMWEGACRHGQVVNCDHCEPPPS